MPRDGRASVRQNERSTVVIAGVDVNGSAFEEITESRDVSEEGISFYLNQPIWINTHLTADVRSSSGSTINGTNRVMVVRIEADGAGKRVVGARFND